MDREGKERKGKKTGKESRNKRIVGREWKETGKERKNYVIPFNVNKTYVVIKNIISCLSQGSCSYRDHSKYWQ